MILFGPHPMNSPEADELLQMDKPFVSAVELAEVALKLAALKGLKEPDVAGAVVLLKQTAKDRFELTALRCAGMRLVQQAKPFCVFAESFLSPEDKEFPGAELIAEPSKFPVSLDEAARMISGEYSRDRRRGYVLRMQNHARQRLGIPLVKKTHGDEEIEDCAHFWTLARDLAPHCPRFAKLYTDTALGCGAPTGRSTKSKRSRKAKRSS